MIRDEKLRAYRESLVSAWGYNDYNDWPIKVNSVMHLFLEFFAEEFIEDLYLLDEKGVKKESIAARFGNPARLYRIIDPVIYGMKRMKIPLEKQREIVFKILSLVKCLKFGSEFNEDGRNEILNPDQASEFLKIKPFYTASIEDSVKLHRFCGAMWAYTESIFFRAHDVTKEIHGLYPVHEESGNLLIREYLRLDGDGIWGDVEVLPYHSIKISAVYDNRLKLKIDSYNHLFLLDGNYNDSLIKYHIQAADESLNVEQLTALIPCLCNTIEKIHKWAEKADWKTKVERYADIYWYRKKALCDLAGKDWQIPELVKESIQKGAVNEARLNILSKEQIDWLIQMVI